MAISVQIQSILSAFMGHLEGRLLHIVFVAYWHAPIPSPETKRIYYSIVNYVYFDLFPFRTIIPYRFITIFITSITERRDDFCIHEAGWWNRDARLPSTYPKNESDKRIRAGVYLSNHLIGIFRGEDGIEWFLSFLWVSEKGNSFGIDGLYPQPLIVYPQP